MHAGGYQAPALWDNVIYRLTNDPNKTGQALTIHFDRLREQLFDFGYMVPPWNLRGNCPALSRQYRGVIKTHDKQSWRFVSWDEDFHPSQDWIKVNGTKVYRRKTDWCVVPGCPFNTSAKTGRLVTKTDLKPGQYDPQKPHDPGFTREPSIRVQHGFGTGSKNEDSDSDSDSDAERPSDRVRSNGSTEEQLGGAENPNADLDEKDGNGLKTGSSIRRKKHGKSSETIIQQFGRPLALMVDNYSSKKAKQATKTSHTGCYDVPDNEMVPKNFAQSNQVKPQGDSDGDEDDKESEEENNPTATNKVSRPNNQTPAGEVSQPTKKVFLRLKLSKGRETNGHHRMTKLKVHQYSRDQLQELQRNNTTTSNRGVSSDASSNFSQFPISQLLMKKFLAN